MSAALDDADVQALQGLAFVLLPATGEMPGVGQIDFPALVRRAAGAAGYEEAEVRAALRAMPDRLDWDRAKAFAGAEPDAFRVLSTLASAAYYMAPAVLQALNYPLTREHPAGMEDFLTEYETGVLDPVMQRGRRYRDVEASAP